MESPIINLAPVLSSAVIASGRGAVNAQTPAPAALASSNSAKGFRSHDQDPN